MQADPEPANPAVDEHSKMLNLIHTSAEPMDDDAHGVVFVLTPDALEELATAIQGEIVRGRIDELLQADTPIEYRQFRIPQLEAELSALDGGEGAQG